MSDQTNPGAPATAPLSFTWNADLTPRLCDLARVAGEQIMAIRAKGTLGTRHKDDGSPVTKADHASQAVLLEGLKALTPSIPVIAEEQDIKSSPLEHQLVWVVDPLDGTRDFVMGGDEFSISIGLLLQGQPLLGLIFAPVRDDLFFGTTGTVFRQLGGKQTEIPPIPSAPLSDRPRLITSRREAKRFPVSCWVKEGHVSSWRICSSAYKFGLLAAGEVDLFVRTGTTYEWDTAAGDAILRALGGSVVTPDGQPLAYGKPELRNSDFLAFRSDFARESLPLFADLIRTTKQTD